MLHILFTNLWQTGNLVLEHEDERTLGLHLLQFTEVLFLEIYTFHVILAVFYFVNLGPFS